MRQEVIFVTASGNNPATRELDELCHEMAERGLALLHVSPSQGEGGGTVGLWLFFSDLNRPASAPEDGDAQEEHGSRHGSPVPKRCQRRSERLIRHPKVFATMHGSTFKGEGQRALSDLALIMREFSADSAKLTE